MQINKIYLIILSFYIFKQSAATFLSRINIYALSLGRTVGIILLSILIVILGYLALNLGRVIRAFRSVFPSLKDFKKEIEQGEEIAQNTPKSLSSLESVVTDQLAQDFPELHLDERKNHLRDLLLETLKSNGYANIDELNDEQKLMRSWWRSKYKVDTEAPIVHAVVLHNYLRDKARRTLIFQASFQFLREGTKTQDRISFYYLYLLDPAERNTSWNCQQCGAPITSLGEKVCTYCGAAQTAGPEMIWTLAEVK
ncbi:MAG TPA: hypothetical protein GXX72_05195 [Clostridiaceae bacterium]|nr:hypothetical protein [Clostridiaceae bacterium]